MSWLVLLLVFNDVANDFMTGVALFLGYHFDGLRYLLQKTREYEQSATSFLTSLD